MYLCCDQPSAVSMCSHVFVCLHVSLSIVRHGTHRVHCLVHVAVIAMSEVEDVRTVLEFYGTFDDPLAAFRENQRKLQVSDRFCAVDNLHQCTVHCIVHCMPCLQHGQYCNYLLN